MVDISRLKRRGPSGNVPRTQSRARGARTLQAIGRIGENLSGLSNQLLAERTAQESREFRDNQSFEYDRQLRAWERDNVGLLKNNPDEYESNHRAFRDSLQSELSEGAPTDDARNQFVNQTNRIRTSSALKADSDIANSARKNNLLTKQSQILEASKMVAESGDAEQADEIAGRLVLAQQEDATIGPKDTFDLQSGTVNELRRSLMTSKINSENLGELAEAKKLLTSDNLVFRNMSNAEMARYEAQIDSAEKRVQGRIRKENRNQVVTAIGAYKSGINADEQTRKILNRLEKTRGAYENDSDWNKLRLGLAESKVLYEVDNTLALTPPSQRPKIENVVREELAGLDPELKEGLEFDVLLKRANNKLAESVNAFYKAPVDFVTARDEKAGQLATAAFNDPEAFQGLKNKMDTIYDSWDFGPANRSYVTSGMINVWGDGITKAMDRKDLDSADALFSQMQRVAQGNIHGLIQDLGKKIPEDFAVIADVKNPTTRRKMISNVVNADSINKNYKAYQTSISDSDDKKSDDQIMQAILSSDFHQSMLIQGGDKVSGRANSLAYAKNAVLRVKEIMPAGEDLDTAVETALKMYTSDYSAAESDYGDIVHIPNKIGQLSINADKVAAKINYIKELQNPSKFFSIAIPEGSSREAVDEDIKNNGRMVLSHDKLGLQLFIGNGLEIYPTEKGQVPFISLEQIQIEDDKVKLPSAWEAKHKGTKEVLRELFK